MNPSAPVRCPHFGHRDSRTIVFPEGRHGGGPYGHVVRTLWHPCMIKHPPDGKPNHVQTIGRLCMISRPACDERIRLEPIPL